jgi:hypothetical protein
MLLVIVQGPKLICLGRYGPHVPMVLHISKDDPEHLGQLLKEVEQEEGALLIPRWGRAPLSRAGGRKGCVCGAASPRAGYQSARE